MQGMLPLRSSRRDRLAAALVLAGLVAFVVLVYVVIVLGGGLLIGHTDSPQVGLSILATAVVAFGFERVRTRLQQLATGLVLGSRASPYEVLQRFSQSVGGTYDARELAGRMAQVLAEGTGAHWSQVWLMVQDRLTLAATWPPGTEADESPPGEHEPPGRRALPVRQSGEVLGVLRLHEDPRRPMTPVEERLFAGLAGQAGLVLRGVRLRAERAQRLAELSARTEELRASRERLVEAQDAARRRLERDIHDGAQQHLVAMAVNLRLVQTLASRAPQRAAGVLTAQCEAVTQMRTALVDLARGIYPRQLTDEGIGPALQAALAGSPVAVDVATHDVGRYDVAVETALYFCCLEAVQNASKHSGAQRVVIDLRDGPDGLVLTVEDDGEGFHENPPRPGVGLANMRDRIEALGGTLLFENAAIGGARVSVRVP